MDANFFITLLTAAIIAGTPILFAALGAIFAERAGILNLGVEGMMLMGAVVGFGTAISTGNLFYSIIFAMAAGGILALIHAFLTITLRADQVVSGLALTIFGSGFSGFIGRSYVGIPAPVTFQPIIISGLSDIPWIGPIFFRHDLLIYISFILVPLCWFYIYKTRPGLTLRSVGENPAAADAAGINVFAVRYLYVIVGGMFAGLGGAYLSLAYAPSWLEHMTAGRGWIAVALVIFAMWNPNRAMLGAYLFGGIDSLAYRLQVLGILVPSFFLKMLPYIFTIIVLITVARKAQRHQGVPGALNIPYHREER